MTLLHFQSHHLLKCKKNIIYSQTLQYNMIISKDHIFQKEHNNLTPILLAHTYLLQLITKELSSTPVITCYLNGHHIQKQTISDYHSLIRHRQIIYNHHI